MRRIFLGPGRIVSMNCSLTDIDSGVTSRWDVATELLCGSVSRFDRRSSSGIPRLLPALSSSRFPGRWSFSLLLPRRPGWDLRGRSIAVICSDAVVTLTPLVCLSSALDTSGYTMIHSAHSATSTIQMIQCLWWWVHVHWMWSGSARKCSFGYDRSGDSLWLHWTTSCILPRGPHSHHLCGQLTHKTIEIYRIPKSIQRCPKIQHN